MKKYVEGAVLVVSSVSILNCAFAQDATEKSYTETLGKNRLSFGVFGGDSFGFSLGFARAIGGNDYGLRVGALSHNYVREDKLKTATANNMGLEFIRTEPITERFAYQASVWAGWSSYKKRDLSGSAPTIDGTVDGGNVFVSGTYQFAFIRRPQGDENFRMTYAVGAMFIYNVISKPVVIGDSLLQTWSFLPTVSAGYHF